MSKYYTDDTFMWENKMVGCPEEDYDRVPREDRWNDDPLVWRITHQSGPAVSRKRAVDELLADCDPDVLNDRADAEIHKPLSEQIGGDHYRQGSIQPIEYIHANDMDFFSGNVVKYITRWKYKNGLEDLNKAKHYIELLIEQEYG